jgi:hypothetical protein
VEFVGAEPPFLHRAGLEILDQDVGLLDEPADDLLPLGNAKVGRDRLLVAADDLPPQLVVARRFCCTLRDDAPPRGE